MNEIEKEVVMLGYYGEIALANIIFRVHGGAYAYLKMVPDHVREQAIRVVVSLMEKGLIVPGFPKYDRPFDVIDLTPEQAAQLIDEEWGKLDHTPLVGEILWFDLTEKGEQVMRDLLDE